MLSWFGTCIWLVGECSFILSSRFWLLVVHKNGGERPGRFCPMHSDVTITWDSAWWSQALSCVFLPKNVRPQHLKDSISTACMLPDSRLITHSLWAKKDRALPALLCDSPLTWCHSKFTSPRSPLSGTKEGLEMSHIPLTGGGLLKEKVAYRVGRDSISGFFQKQWGRLLIAIYLFLQLSG